jgi:hypothetical protein
VERDRKVILAKVTRLTRTQVEMFEPSFRDEMLRAVDPKVVVTRRNRAWRFSRPHVEGSYLFAKLGFERSATHGRARYNEELQDFEAVANPSEEGSYSHFALDLVRQYIIFEERSTDINRASFIAAFQARLNEISRDLRVDFVVNAAAFKEWLTTIDRLTYFGATLRPPNPKWKPDVREIRELIERTAAEEMNITAKVHSNDGQLNPQGSIIEETVAYAEDSYADYHARAVGKSKPRMFTSKQNVVQGIVRESDEDTDHSIWEKLRITLEELAP